MYIILQLTEKIIEIVKISMFAQFREVENVPNVKDTKSCLTLSVCNMAPPCFY